MINLKEYFDILGNDLHSERELEEKIDATLMSIQNIYLEPAAI